MATLKTNKFSPQDFKGGGQYIVRGKKGTEWEVFTDGGRASTFISKIGYDHVNRKGGGNANMVSMADGWTHHVGTKQQLCDHLNNNKNGDKYRWANKEELLLVIESQIGYRIKG